MRYAPGIFVAAAIVFLVSNMLIGLMLGLVGGVVAVVEKVRSSE